MKNILPLTIRNILIAMSMIFYMSLSSTLYAQQKAITTLTAGGNVSIFKIQDSGMSPVRYNGFIPGLQMSLERIKPNSISTVQISGAKGVLNAKSRRDGKVSRVNQDGFEVYYSYLRKFSNRDENTWRIFAGLQIGTILRHRIHNKLANSARLYESISYVGPALKAERSFRLLGMPLLFGARLQVPAFAAVLRPSITNLSNYLGQDDDEFKSRFEEHGFTSFNNLLMIQSQLSLRYKLKNLDEIQLNYNWEFIDYTKPNQMQSANHLIGVSYVKLFGTRLKKVGNE
ncbi:hypothetical protein ACFCT7_06720 [Fulvivirgaceae bacterium LMO-SS25]